MRSEPDIVCVCVSMRLCARACLFVYGCVVDLDTCMRKCMCACIHFCMSMPIRVRMWMLCRYDAWCCVCRMVCLAVMKRCT